LNLDIHGFGRRPVRNQDPLHPVHSSGFFLQPKERFAFHTSHVRISSFMDAVPMKTGQLAIDLGYRDGRVLRRARKR